MNLRALTALFTALFLTCNIAHAREQFGSVDAVYGRATVTAVNGQPVAVSVGQKISEGDTIKTATDGEVHLVTQDGAFIALRPNTELRVDEYKADGGTGDRTFMTLLVGTLRSITGWIGKRDHAAYALHTPGATIGIRGTDHETTVVVEPGRDAPGTYDTVIEGATVLTTASGSANVAPGKFAYAPQGKAEAPYLLAKAPEYLAARSLKIEERIQQRKEFLRERLERMREDRISQVKSENAAHPELHEHNERHDHREHEHKIRHEP